MSLSKQQTDFAVMLAVQGGPFAIQYDIPIAAMVACGCFESGWGTKGVYLLTGCPFNLQKPKEWKYPICDILKDQDTFSDRESKNKVKAPFCMAKDLGDAGRIFCEWIVHWPNASARHNVLALSSDAKKFARRLPWVGFGARKAGGGDQGDEYANLVDPVSEVIPFELIGEND